MTALKEEQLAILLVDDEQDIRDVLEVALIDAGHVVLTAENGQEAMKVFRHDRPAIVITDIKMPVMDGIELLQRIKRDAPETEVIMITGHGDMDLAVKSLKHKATDFITKPINVDALDIALQRTRERIVMRRKLQDYTTHLEALIREKSELQDHLSSLGLMIGSISHGIKGLLTGLDGGMYLLEKGIKRHDEACLEEGWQTVKLLVERIRKLIMDILFHAKKRDLNWEQVDLGNFVEELARIMENRLGQSDITFERHFNGLPATGIIDPGYIHAALMNLFENAIDACQRSEAEGQRTISFGLDLDETSIVFTVCDNGIGMDAQTQEQLFTLFFSSKGIKGTGLGLFITKNIVEQHGGDISVSSSPGRGSRFTITLPVEGIAGK